MRCSLPRQATPNCYRRVRRQRVASFETQPFLSCACTATNSKTPLQRTSATANTLRDIRASAATTAESEKLGGKARQGKARQNKVVKRTSKRRLLQARWDRAVRLRPRSNLGGTACTRHGHTAASAQRCPPPPPKTNSSTPGSYPWRGLTLATP